MGCMGWGTTALFHSYSHKLALLGLVCWSPSYFRFWHRAGGCFGRFKGVLPSPGHLVYSVWSNRQGSSIPGMSGGWKEMP